MSQYMDLVRSITNEVSQVLERVDPNEAERMVDELINARRVFIFAVGRVFLALQCLGKRLGHLQIDCQVVGSITEKPIGAEDVLLIASGSGESRLPLEITRIAKKHKARIGLITASMDSSIRRMSDFCLMLPCPTKLDSSSGIQSIQPMSTLFDQCLHLLSDIFAMMIQEKSQLSNQDIWQYHANLE